MPRGSELSSLASHMPHSTILPQAMLSLEHTHNASTPNTRWNRSPAHAANLPKQLSMCSYTAHVTRPRAESISLPTAAHMGSQAFSHKWSMLKDYYIFWRKQAPALNHGQPGSWDEGEEKTAMPKRTAIAACLHDHPTL